MASRIGLCDPLPKVWPWVVLGTRPVWAQGSLSKGPEGAGHKASVSPAFCQLCQCEPSQLAQVTTRSDLAHFVSLGLGHVPRKTGSCTCVSVGNGAGGSGHPSSSVQF